MLLVAILAILLIVDNVCASLGDRLIIYHELLQSCFQSNCSSPDSLSLFEQKQPIYLQLFGWDCLSECKYQSQWSTLDQLQQNHIDNIPQFYGKWTFRRFLGIQEPASFIFSLMNFVSNLYGWIKYRRRSGKRDPLYGVWRIQTLIALNAWIWSSIYHARDTPLSEKLDYFSAYCVVIFSLCAIVFKVLFEIESRQLVFVSVAIAFLSFYLYHTHYLYFVVFDYGYNMKVNLITGILSTVCWLFWCYHHRQRRSHVLKCVLSLVCINLSLLFELMDFPPIAFVFDAHSLWHLSTFAIPFLWFDFLSDEAIYLAKSAPLDAIHEKIA